MQVVRSFDQERATSVGRPLRAMLVAGTEGDISEKRLVGAGVQVRRAGDPYTAMSAVMDDPGFYDMLVVECDGLGGEAEARRIMKLMGETMLRVPVILVTRECQTQSFALERHEPTILRAPLSAVSMRVALDHVMRDRMAPLYA